MFWIVILIFCLILAYWFLIKPYNYWIEKGVKQSKPVPLFGDNFKTFIRAQSSTDLIQNLYNIHPDTRYVGTYQMVNPVLVVRDPELIKQLTVKEFDHFLNHPGFTSEDIDPLWTKNLVSLKDQKWRDMRSTLSPAFTSSKMRQMFELMTEISEQFVEHFLKKNEDIITIELKDIFTRYANDVIASVAFGIKCDSLKEPNNQFYIMGKEVTDFAGFWKMFKFLLLIAFPKAFTLLKIRLFPKRVGDFFTNIITENIKQREDYGIVRNDMIQLLLDARKNDLKQEENNKKNKNEVFATAEEENINTKPTISHKKELTDLDITSQALIFFFGGFDSVSNAMCFMGYELGANPEIQERLYEEINNTFEHCKGRLTYEALMKMKYMDMVVSETLRKWPNAIATDRICTKSYTIEPIKPDERPLHLDVGNAIFVPIFGLHRDPIYYPDPERFDPERFNDENKHKINPYAYIPFGAGPRNCIASRFALLEMKVLFFYVLKHFEIVPIEKTQIPMKISKKTLNITAEDGYWFGLKRRVK